MFWDHVPVETVALASARVSWRISPSIVSASAACVTGRGRAPLLPSTAGVPWRPRRGPQRMSNRDQFLEMGPPALFASQGFSLWIYPDKKFRNGITALATVFVDGHIVLLRHWVMSPSCFTDRSFSSDSLGILSLLKTQVHFDLLPHLTNDPLDLVTGIIHDGFFVHQSVDHASLDFHGTGND